MLIVSPRGITPGLPAFDPWLRLGANETGRDLLSRPIWHQLIAGSRLQPESVRPEPDLLPRWISSPGLPPVYERGDRPTVRVTISPVAGDSVGSPALRANIQLRDSGNTVGVQSIEHIAKPTAERARRAARGAPRSSPRPTDPLPAAEPKLLKRSRSSRHSRTSPQVDKAPRRPVPQAAAPSAEAAAPSAEASAKE